VYHKLTVFREKIPASLPLIGCWQLGHPACKTLTLVIHTVSCQKDLPQVIYFGGKIGQLEKSQKSSSSSSSSSRGSWVVVLLVVVVGGGGGGGGGGGAGGGNIPRPSWWEGRPLPDPALTPARGQAPSRRGHSSSARPPNVEHKSAPCQRRVSVCGGLCV